MTTFLTKPIVTQGINLTGVNPDLVENMYHLERSEKKSLIPKKVDSSVSYLDSTRRNRKCTITMKNYLSGDVIPLKYSGNCFNCHHTFPGQPISCPIEYVPSTMTKIFFSTIIGVEQKIKRELTAIESRNYVSKGILPIDKDNGSSNIKVDLNDYYNSDGFFCSLECCFNFIKENKKNPLYKNSEVLLYDLAEDYFGDRPNYINRAPNFRLLSKYGGNLSIEEYRRGFHTVEIRDRGDNISKVPVLYPIGKMYDEILNL